MSGRQLTIDLGDADTSFGELLNPHWGPHDGQPGYTVRLWAAGQVGDVEFVEFARQTDGHEEILRYRHHPSVHPDAPVHEVPVSDITRIEFF